MFLRFCLKRVTFFGLPRKQLFTCLQGLVNLMLGGVCLTVCLDLILALILTAQRADKLAAVFFTRADGDAIIPVSKILVMFHQRLLYLFTKHSTHLSPACVFLYLALIKTSLEILQLPTDKWHKETFINQHAIHAIFYE